MRITKSYLFCEVKRLSNELDRLQSRVWDLESGIILAERVRKEIEVEEIKPSETIFGMSAHEYCKCD